MMPEFPARAIVSDDGSTIWVTSYAEEGAAVSVELSPLRALALADELLCAAIPKLGTCAQSAPRSALEEPVRRRGGDAHAVKRQRRDEAIRTVAPLIAAGQSIEVQARVLARRLATFQPMADETAPERRLLQAINGFGLPVGQRRIREILAKQ